MVNAAQFALDLAAASAARASASRWRVIPIHLTSSGASNPSASSLSIVASALAWNSTPGGRVDASR